MCLQFHWPSYIKVVSVKKSHSNHQTFSARGDDGRARETMFLVSHMAESQGDPGTLLCLHTVVIVASMADISHYWVWATCGTIIQNSIKNAAISLVFGSLPAGTLEVNATA